MWFFDHPEVPTGPGPWAFSNDRGTTPGYWYPFNGTTTFPSNGTYAQWSTTTEDSDRDSDRDSGEFNPAENSSSSITERALPQYINGYAEAGCPENRFQVQIAQPRSGTCYGIWGSNTRVYAAFASDSTTQTNFYVDAGCDNYYLTARNWIGCSNPFVAPVRSIWSVG